MKHRSFFFVVLAALPFAVAAGQVPPTPPVPPVPPVVEPPVVPVPSIVTFPDFDRSQIDAIRRSADDARRLGDQARELAREQARISADDIRRMTEDARQMARFSAQDIRVSVPFEYDSHFNFNFNFDSFGDIGPRPSWAQGDPADSAWRMAREAINRTDYSKAAGLFADLLAKYPGSRYAPDAAYWEAFARYRVGTLDQLHLAIKALDANTSRIDYMSQKSDVPALRARILSALASRGERGADDQLKALYAQYPTMCDREQVQIKSQVLNSMYQSDPEGTMPLIRKQLESRDACSAELRRTAVFLLANRPDEQKAALIAQVAKNDTVREVRRQAIDLLARMPGDASISTLQDLMRDDDEQIQAAAVRALMRSDNPKARAAMRTLIDRKDAPERQRVEAIQSFDRDMTADDAAYLRALYAREPSERVKDAILSALSRTGTEDNVNFLLSVAKNTNESSSLRSSALNRISRTNLSVEDLGKLYDATDSRSMRTSLVRALGTHKEDAATNKLLEIVKLSTDPEVKTYAIRMLLDKKDPEVNKKLAAVINP